jgi:hypothetical protein
MQLQKAARQNAARVRKEGENDANQATNENGIDCLRCSRSNRIHHRYRVGMFFGLLHSEYWGVYATVYLHVHDLLCQRELQELPALRL